MKTTTYFYRSLILSGLFILTVLCSNPLYAQFGDNLGKHKADRALDMNSKNLTNVALLKYKTLEVTDKASGDIGTAATTVDLYTVFEVDQTTAAQALTLPSPTTPFAGQAAYVKNTGTAPFTMYGATVAAGEIIGLNYNGTAWSSATTLGGDISGTVGNASVNKLKNASLTFTGLANNNLLQYNGTDWINAAPSTLGTIGLLTGTTGTDVNVSGSPATLGSSITLNIPDAGTGVRGLVTTGAQALEGVKTFNAAPILNTLTAGSIPFIGSSKSVAENNPNLFWDNTNNRLGIGTPSPVATLHNAGSTILGNLAYTNAAASYTIPATTVDNYSGIAITQTTIASTITLTVPTEGVTPGHQFSVTNATASAYTILVSYATGTSTSATVSLTPGTTNCFVYDGSYWSPTGSSASSATQFKTVTASTTFNASYMGCTVSCDASTSTQANVLPTAVGKAGQYIELYRADATNNALYFTGTSGQTIGSSDKLYLYNKGDVVTVRSDDANWIITGDNRTAQNGSSKSYMHAAMTSNQTSNYSTNDHIKYVTVLASAGSDITLDASTPYSASPNVASLGRFTLKAGKTYHLVGNVPWVNYSSGGSEMQYVWYNANTTTQIGTMGGNTPGTYTNNYNKTSYAEAVFTPTTDTRVELRITGSLNTTGISVTEESPTAYIECLSVPATVVNTVDYSYGTFSGSGYATNTNFTLTQSAGSMSVGSNYITLKAGKTYRLSASVSAGSTSYQASFYFISQWYNITSSSTIGNQAISLLPEEAQGVNITPQATSEVIFTPSVDTNVGYRFTSLNFSSGTADIRGYSYYAVQQIGSTAVTSVPGNLVGTMTGATASAAGASGAVPTPAAGDQRKTLLGSGTWGYTAPAGVMNIFAGASTNIPSGWLLCDGSSLLRANYLDLFAAIGTAWGTADATHFNLPDMRGLFPRGVDGGIARDPNRGTRTEIKPGGNTGDAVGSLQDNAVQAHDHATNIVHYAGSYAAAGGSGATLFTWTTSNAGTAGTGAETRPKNVNVNYIIKY